MFTEAIERIQKAARILIVPHIMPDGDTLGSSVALKLALEHLGKSAFIHSVDPLPEDISFIDASFFSDATSFLPMADLVIAVDSSDPGRLAMPFEKLKAIDLVNIDHHRTNERFGRVNVVDPEAAATGELVYDLILQMGIELDRVMAEHLYAAIATDTGRFLYSNTRPRTLRIVADLMEKGIDMDRLNILLYQNLSLDKVLFECEALLDMELLFNRRVSVISLKKGLFEKYGLPHTASDGIVERARNIRRVQVSILLKEMEGGVKGSMRSKGSYDVSELAAFFGGGGHRNAAGFMIQGSMEDVRDALIERVGVSYGDA